MDTADGSKQAHKTLLQPPGAAAEALEAGKEAEEVGTERPAQSVWSRSALGRIAHSQAKKSRSEIAV